MHLSFENEKNKKPSKSLSLVSKSSSYVFFESFLCLSPSYFLVLHFFGSKNSFIQWIKKRTLHRIVAVYSVIITKFVFFFVLVDLLSALLHICTHNSLFLSCFPAVVAVVAAIIHIIIQLSCFISLFACMFVCVCCCVAFFLFILNHFSISLVFLEMPSIRRDVITFRSTHPTNAKKH